MAKFKKFEKVEDYCSFPFDECDIPLRINNSFLRSSKIRTVMIFDAEKKSITFRNLYPCINSTDDVDILGFCNLEETEFYCLPGFKNQDKLKSMGLRESLLDDLDKEINKDIFFHDLLFHDLDDYFSKFGKSINAIGFTDELNLNSFVDEFFC